MTALSYSIRDREDREVARESTLARARNTARKYGPGSVVLGARGQTIYTVPPKLPRDSGNTNVAANGQ